MFKTNAADAGAVLLDLGNAKGAPSPGGDSGFAGALDGQMRRLQESGRPGDKPPAAEQAGESQKRDAPEREETNPRETAARKEPVDEHAATVDKQEQHEPADDGAPASRLIDIQTAADVQTGKPLPPDAGNRLPDAQSEAGRLIGLVADGAAPGEAPLPKLPAAPGVLAEAKVMRPALEQSRGVPRLFPAVVEQAEVGSEQGGQRGTLAREGEPQANRFFDLLTAGRSALAAGEGKGTLSAPVPERTVFDPARVAAPVGGHTVGGQSPAPAPSGAPSLTMPVSVPMQQPGWDRAFGERVVWMARHNVQEASIQLNPRHLGPVELRVTVNQDQVSVQFQVQNPLTREAVEAAMPRLREMLSESGLTLAQSNVSDQSQHGRTGQGHDGGSGDHSAAAGRNGADGAAPDDGSVALHESRVPAENGLVDFFA